MPTTGTPATGGKPDSPTPGGTPTQVGGVTAAAPATTEGVKPAETAQQIGKDLQAKGVKPGTGTAASLAVQEGLSPATGEHTGEEPKNVPEANDSAPIGDQAKPAVMTPQGSLPVQQVATTSGLQPAAIIGDEKVAEKLVEQRDVAARGIRQRAHRHITQDQINGMTKAELRAVAYDRGYDIGEGGTRILRERFAKAVAEDDLIEDRPDGQLSASQSNAADGRKSTGNAEEK